MSSSYFSEKKLFLDKKFVFLTFVKNLFFCLTIFLNNLFNQSSETFENSCVFCKNSKFVLNFIPSAIQFCKGSYRNPKNRPRK